MTRMWMSWSRQALTALVVGLSWTVAGLAADAAPPAPAPMPAPDAPAPLPKPPAGEQPPVKDPPVPPGPPAVAEPPAPDPKLEDGIYARIETPRGRIYCRLFYDKAIRTVDNFVALAEGTKSWTDPLTQKVMEKTPLFDGLKFHRVEEQVVQTGDPLNTGEGGPGFTLPDEYYPDLRFDKAGIVGMARMERPNTAGSQFFITLVPLPFLNDHYTAFGEVVDGMEVVKKLQRGDAMQKVTILRIGAAAQKYDFAAGIKARGDAQAKPLPAKIADADPARVPVKDQPANDDIVVRGCMIVYKGAMMEGAYTARTKEEAKTLAEKVVAMARAKDADTSLILKEWTEVPADHPMHMTKGQLPPAFESTYRLKMGQVSDPLDAPMGYIIFARVEPVFFHAQHILIQYKGSMRAETERTKEEAKKMAEDLRIRLVDKKEDFTKLAKENSDDPTTKTNGGDLGEWEQGEMVPEFDEATEKLKVDEVSTVIESPFGFHIIKRLKLEPKAAQPMPVPQPGGIELPTPTPVPQPLPAPVPGN